MAQSLLEHHLSRPQARKVSRALKAIGYQRATYAFCYDTVVHLSTSLEPFEFPRAQAVGELIMVAAGLKPPKDSKEEEVKG